jgi:UDP-N-acetylmuramoyl-L-alanyl-D-glutamate--2,6-diaminopimelate ligase
MVRTPVGSSRVHLRLRGRFNVYNALAAIALTQALGVSLPQIVSSLAEFPGVPGRFESLDEGQPFGVIVDYAHTPDGLENVLQTAREFVRGRTVAVFGCGGDRDRAKRPLMGRIAARLADIAIVTSDNPRSEEPMAIIDEILAGIAPSPHPPPRRGEGEGEGARVESHGEARVEVESDRRKAIYRAIELAQRGDMVIIAGKGHEPYQEIKGVKHPFDDRVVVREALRQLKDLGPRA